MDWKISLWSLLLLVMLVMVLMAMLSLFECCPCISKVIRFVVLFNIGRCCFCCWLRCSCFWSLSCFVANVDIVFLCWYYLYKYCLCCLCILHHSGAVMVLYLQWNTLSLLVLVIKTSTRYTHQLFATHSFPTCACPPQHTLQMCTHQKRKWGGNVDTRLSECHGNVTFSLPSVIDIIYDLHLFRLAQLCYFIVNIERWCLPQKLKQCHREWLTICTYKR